MVFVSDWWVAATLLSQLLIVSSAVMFAAACLDDLIFDLYFYIASLWRKLRRYGVVEPDHDQLLSLPEKPLAVMLPAWQESEILPASVPQIISSLEYSNYCLFIGVYPNDPDTLREATALARAYKNVHYAVTPAPGPTCKADCLNTIIDAVRRVEQASGIRFEGFVMQDAEDIVDPDSLRAFNWHLDAFDLIQLPVRSLPRAMWSLVGGHYMDEFAEQHGREIVAREMFSGIVPGAGVATAYSRNALQLDDDEEAVVFSTDTVTEDYDFSFILQNRGSLQHFARIKSRSRDTDLIGTRELFPNKFWAAVRQKTRWILGISFQGWEHFSWGGNWRAAYMYWRDRKALLFGHAVPLAYLGLLIFGVLFLIKAAAPLKVPVLAPLIPDSSWLWTLVGFNISVIVYRIAIRHYWTGRTYGLKALVTLIPRYFMGSLINYTALCRATLQYFTHRVTGKKIGWDKTTHDYPDFAAARPVTDASPTLAALRNSNGPIRRPINEVEGTL